MGFITAWETPQSVGYNIQSVGPTSIQLNSRMDLNTGLSMEIPTGMCGRMAPRSGLSLKHGIDILGRVIDPDYRGEVKVIIIDSSQKKFTINKDEKIPD